MLVKERDSFGDPKPCQYIRENYCLNIRPESLSDHFVRLDEDVRSDKTGLNFFFSFRLLG